MIQRLHHAFGRTVQARAWALLVAAAGLAPQVAPKDLAAWVSEQVPWAPSWASWGVSAVIVAYRLWVASKAVSAEAAP